MTTTDTAVPSHDNPQEVFAEAFVDELLANNIGPALTCHKVNALAGLLNLLGRGHGARRWLRAHKHACEEADRHQ